MDVLPPSAKPDVLLYCTFKRRVVVLLLRSKYLSQLK